MLLSPALLFKNIKFYVKRMLVQSAKALPVKSKYLGPVKGYYVCSKDYYKAFKYRANLDLSYKVFCESMEIQRLPPRQPLQDQVHWKFRNRYKSKIPESFVISFSEGRVVGDCGAIITHDDKLLLDVSPFFSTSKTNTSEEKARSHYALNHFKFPRCLKFDQTFAVLSTAGSSQYYHWLLDALPRLKILREILLDDFEGIDKFIVSKGLPVINETLELMHLPSEKLYVCNTRTHVQASRLIIPSIPPAVEWKYNFLRNEFLKPDLGENSIQRIYISRSKAKYRQIKNEKEVLKLLFEFGFVPMCLEDYSFKDQISIFSNAEIVVAPHGAGLTNIVWCRKGTKILEIFSPNYVNPCYWEITSQLGIDYFYLLGEGDQPPQCYDPRRVKDDIEVSIRKLRTAVEIIMLQL
jgi:capsular polysaccharide biosynthesis protein